MSSNIQCPVCGEYGHTHMHPEDAPHEVKRFNSRRGKADIGSCGHCGHRWPLSHTPNEEEENE